MAKENSKKTMANQKKGNSNRVVLELSPKKIIALITVLSFTLLQVIPVGLAAQQSQPEAQPGSEAQAIQQPVVPVGNQPTQSVSPTGVSTPSADTMSFMLRSSALSSGNATSQTGQGENTPASSSTGTATASSNEAEMNSGAQVDMPAGTTTVSDVPAADKAEILENLKLPLETNVEVSKTVVLGDHGTRNIYYYSDAAMTQLLGSNVINYDPDTGGHWYMWRDSEDHSAGQSARNLPSEYLVLPPAAGSVVDTESPTPAGESSDTGSDSYSETMTDSGALSDPETGSEVTSDTSSSESSSEVASGSASEVGSENASEIETASESASGTTSDISIPSSETTLMDSLIPLEMRSWDSWKALDEMSDTDKKLADIKQYYDDLRKKAKQDEAKDQELIADLPDAREETHVYPGPSLSSLVKEKYHMIASIINSQERLAVAETKMPITPEMMNEIDFNSVEVREVRGLIKNCWENNEVAMGGEFADRQRAIVRAYNIVAAPPFQGLEWVLDQYVSQLMLAKEILGLKRIDNDLTAIETDRSYIMDLYLLNKKKAPDSTDSISPTPGAEPTDTSTGTNSDTGPYLLDPEDGLPVIDPETGFKRLKNGGLEDGDGNVIYPTSDDQESDEETTDPTETSTPTYIDTSVVIEPETNSYTTSEPEQTEEVTPTPTETPTETVSEIVSETVSEASSETTEETGVATAEETSVTTAEETSVTTAEETSVTTAEET
ncbi:MAG: hypothetical protein WCP55_15250, partial [Lentisphaerota bacterium]